MKKALLLLIVTLIMNLFFSCAKIIYKEDRASFNDRINKLELEIKKDRDNYKAMGNLGVLYFKTEQYDKACEIFPEVYEKNKNDGKILYYYGLSLEFITKKNEAINVYKNYPNVNRFSSYRSKIEGRFHWLVRIAIREDIKARVQQEDKLSLKELSPDKIAVFPFNFSDGNPQYAALGKGLSEMIITDLSQVKRLQLVERVRIQALMEEMALGQTGLIEEKSSAKFGKLLGAGKIIHGNIALLAGNNVRLDASYWDVINSQFPKVAALDDRLYNLFKMEKDIVFKIIGKMGIQLTPQEREKIQYISTKNIQAFMEYCHGLEKQDQGKFIEAEQYFKNALKFDPNFKAAKQNADLSKRINNFSGSYEKYAFEAGGQFDITGARSQNLINSRLQNMGENIGSSFIPGEESRESAQEAASKIGLDKLPDPPEPPGN